MAVVRYLKYLAKLSNQRGNQRQLDFPAVFLIDVGQEGVIPFYISILTGLFFDPCRFFDLWDDLVERKQRNLVQNIVSSCSFHSRLKKACS